MKKLRIKTVLGGEGKWAAYAECKRTLQNVVLLCIQSKREITRLFTLGIESLVVQPWRVWLSRLSASL